MEKRWVTSYHVTFLSNPVSRTWCIESQVAKVSQCPRLYLPRDQKLVFGIDIQALLSTSSSNRSLLSRESQQSVFSMYTSALKMSKEERIEKFAFMNRCSANIARSMLKKRSLFESGDPNRNPGYF